MSLQSDLITALSAVAGGRVYPQFAPADAVFPLVIYRVLNKDPLITLSGGTIETNSIVAFESYADTYSQALSTSAAVESAIAASGLTHYETTAPGEEYEQAIDAYMEPVFYGFWHT